MLKRRIFVLIIILTFNFGFSQSKKDSLLTIWNDSNQSDSLRARSIYLIAKDVYLYNKPDSAFYFCELGFQFSKNNLLKEQMGNFRNLQAASFYVKGDYFNSIKYNYKSLAIREEINDKKGIGKSLNNIGLIYYELKNYPLAQKFLLKGLAIREELKDSVGIAGSLNNIGLTYLDQQENSKAIKYLSSSLEIKEKLGDRLGMSSAYNNLGILYKDTGEKQKALDYYFKSLKIDEEENSLNGIASVSNNLADIYFELKNYPLAIRYCKRSLAASGQTGSLKEIMYANRTLYRIYNAKGNYQKALDYFKKYIATKNRLESEENQQELVRQELKYDYEKKASIDSISFEKEKKIRDRQIQIGQAELKRKRIEQLFLFCGIALTIIFLLILYSRFKLIRKQKLIIEDQNKKISWAMKKIEAKALRVQMNPHFVFNALNGIQNILFSKGEKEANKYIGYFSKLMRYTMDMNNLEETTLSNEIDYLKSYIAIENMRLNDSINVIYDIDTSLNLSEITIPTMLIQPVVENAIVHGLTPKKFDKSLTISVNESREIVAIEILDNGIGREASGKLKNKNSFKKHKSLATKILMERIDNLNSSGFTKITFRIIDLYNDENPSGTKAILEIPIRNNL